MEQTIICKDCGEAFTLEEKEVEWYKEHGFELPKRCKKCRDARKAQRKDRD